MIPPMDLCERSRLAGFVLSVGSASGRDRRDARELATPLARPHHGALVVVGHAFLHVIAFSNVVVFQTSAEDDVHATVFKKRRREGVEYGCKPHTRGVNGKVGVFTVAWRWFAHNYPIAVVAVVSRDTFDNGECPLLKRCGYRRDVHACLPLLCGLCAVICRDQCIEGGKIRREKNLGRT